MSNEKGLVVDRVVAESIVGLAKVVGVIDEWGNLWGCDGFVDV